LTYLSDRLSLATPQDDRRAELFRESPREMLERYLLGAAWAMQPQRVRGLPGVAHVLLRDAMARHDILPDPETALASPPGLAGIVHDLSAPTLVDAYERGLYPFSHLPPLKWWSPPTRSLLFFHNHHIAKTVRAKLKQARYTVTFDRDFEAVIAGCAGRRDGRWHLTWITPRIMQAYGDLFDAGHVHSFEVWNEAGALVGGGYGVALGRVFYTESQFSHEDNTSKLGFSVLNWHLAQWGYVLNDGKSMTPTIREMGFREIPRDEFLELLARYTPSGGKPGRWVVETDTKTVAAWEPKAQAIAAE